MTLGKWARSQGIAYCTAWRWVRTNRMPVPWSQTPSGAILVEQPQETLDRVALYARVSSNDQKSDLERQLGRLSQYATVNGMSVVRTVAEIGSGLKGTVRNCAECSLIHLWRRLSSSIAIGSRDSAPSISKLRSSRVVGVSLLLIKARCTTISCKT
jgi:putative resolvase